MQGTKICKVCGKEYPYCKTITDDIYRWQDVGCSPECAEKYFKQIAESRGELNSAKAEKVEKPKKAEVKEEQVPEVQEAPQEEESVPVVSKAKRK